MTEPWVVASQADAEGLLYELVSECVFERRPVGLDTETLGCNPEVESPVGRARVWCATLAWGRPSKPPSPFRSAFVPQEFLHVLKPFLADARYPKVGTNLHGFDRHALANEGIELRGIVACTSAQSRLLNPSQEAGHGLKRWGERLGYRVRSFAEVATVPINVGEGCRVEYRCSRHTHKRKRKTCPECGEHVVRAELDKHTRIRWEEWPLDAVWQRRPHQRTRILEYATQDAAMSLDVYWHLQRQLETTAW